MTLVIAHRGASAAHPPGNTLEAFRAAAEMGADWVELDVRPAADGTLVVHHDDRLGDGRLVAETPPGALPEWVPALDAALAACAPMGVIVEIKIDVPIAGTPRQDRLVDDVAALLLGRHGPSAFLVTSFDWSVADRVRRLTPDLPTGLTFDLAHGPDPVEAAFRGGHATINPWDHSVTAELVERAHRHDVAVHTWTVDDPDRMASLAAMGVDGLITNVPDVARSVLASR